MYYIFVALILFVSSANAQTLKGTRAEVGTAHKAAVENDFSFLQNPAEVNRLIKLGLLVKLPGNSNYGLATMQFPYVRQEVKLFVERFSSQYRAGCGQKLVVTSATRVTSRQPMNASKLSVHPTGMAVDFRIPTKTSCRAWLDRNLLITESRGIALATRERNPPHYHVVVLTKQYSSFVGSLSALTAPTATVQHRVRSGETLSGLAVRYKTTVAKIKATNGLRSSVVKVGQVLKIVR